MSDQRNELCSTVPDTIEAAGRRRFLGLGAAAVLAATAWRAQSGEPQDVAAAGKTAGGRSIIDVHHHMFAPAMVHALRGTLPDSVLADHPRSLIELDAGRVQTAMISSPNSDIVKYTQGRLVSLIQKSNDYTSRVARDSSGRYGLFASLPMPYIDASLKEIERVFDVLKSDGVLLITNYSNKWLGDAEFSPVLAELNRRKAVVFTHPNAADYCKGLIAGLSDAIVEFETDTARTIASLLFTGTAEKYPDIRFIFSHAGGTLPALIERFERATVPSPGVAKNVPRGVLAYLRSFYYDTAQAANPMALGALLQFIPSSQVMFGTDFPYRHVDEQVKQLEGMNLGDGKLKGILSGNARRLLTLA